MPVELRGPHAVPETERDEERLVRRLERSGWKKASRTGW